ncbi:conserved exported hypothetical protein [Candidatus Sulfopaludibacter sp. SbA3]|nr:conserved exported hypothetical protein [Candidatus Sulfopaludibacter sp. SbA3]
MKNLTINLMLATAALVVASTTASAQSMRVTIPFTFNAGGNTLEPGTYSVYDSDGQKLFRLRNIGTGHTVLLSPQVAKDPQKASENGVIVFNCTDGCALKQIWTHTGFPAQQFAGLKPEGKSTRVMEIRLVSGSAK